MDPDLEEIPSQTTQGRLESPTLEKAAQKAIAGAIRELVEKKYLYQKITVDLSGVEAALKPLQWTIIGQHFQQRNRVLHRTAGGGSASEREADAIWAQKQKDALSEVERRPWFPVTRHMGDDPATARILTNAQVGCQALGTPANQLNLSFYLPSVQLICFGECKGAMTHVALVGSGVGGFAFGGPFPAFRSKGTEQVFLLFYRCESCRKTVYSVLVRRVGLRLHLCGCAPQREKSPTRTVPGEVEPILKEAEAAVAEGDLFAGFYHLRTLLEHYLKLRLGKPLEERIQGDDLVALHYDQVPLPLRSVLPSLKAAYEKLSECLHARRGKSEDFDEQLTAICDHIEGLALLQKHSLPPVINAPAVTTAPPAGGGIASGEEARIALDTEPR